ncbi:MAG: hypothetical protein WAX14_21590 [Rhodococcus sp. (in: high G+C Gram-positive bacteria)]|uniref:hypothetical protein n=1 Tax=Rhodococcus sp. TaxID=1831 RepID=UPI003BB6DCAB
MNENDSADASTPRVGRPRKYASPADRVRAHRERERQRKESAQLAELTHPADPSEGAANLSAAVSSLRTLTAASLEQYTAVAAQITAAIDKLTDPAALEAQLTKASTELAKVKADADAKIMRLREQLAQATEDRENADAAVDAVDAELAEARAAHSERMHQLQVAHENELAGLKDRHVATLDRWRTQLDDAAAEHTRVTTDLQETIAAQKQHVTDVTADRDALRAELTRAHTDLARTQADLARTQADVDQRTATATRIRTDLDTERTRIAELRDALEHARITAAAAQAAESAARNRGDELRAESAELRAEVTELRSEVTGLRSELAGVRAARAQDIAESTQRTDPEKQPPAQ